jgi:tetratricopeptide (TPR) repeat protein
LAQLYGLRNDYSRLAQVLADSVRVLEALEGRKDLSPILARFASAVFQENLGLIEPADREYQAGLDQAQRLLGDNHYLVAFGTHAYSSFLLYKKHDLARGTEMLRAALASHRRFWGDQSLPVGETLAVLGQWRLDGPMDRERVEKDLREAVEILGTFPKRTSYVSSLERLVDVLKEKKAYDDAVTYGRELVDAIKRQKGERHRDVAERLVSLAKLYSAKGDLDTTLSVLRQALSAGYTNADHIETTPELAPLKDRSDFKQLIERMKNGRLNPP